MTYKEVADSIYKLSMEVWALHHETSVYVNDRCMIMADAVLRNTSHLLTEAYEMLTEE